MTGLSSLNANILSRSAQRYVLADTSKFGRGAFFSYTPLEGVDEVLTNAPPQEAMVNRLLVAGITVRLSCAEQGKKEGQPALKPKIRTPYFEIGTKNYVYGDTALEYALGRGTPPPKNTTSTCSSSYPRWRSGRVAENTKRLIVLAALHGYNRTWARYGGHPARSPEGGGGEGRGRQPLRKSPCPCPPSKKTIDRARALDFLVFACADSIEEAKAIAQLHPDIINPEPTELIGGGAGGVSDMGYVMEFESAPSRRSTRPSWSNRPPASPNGQQVYDFHHGGLRSGGRRVRHHERQRPGRHDRRNDIRNPQGGRRTKFAAPIGGIPLVYREAVQLQSNERAFTFHNVTEAAKAAARRSGIQNGLVSVYSHHTTCCVITQECAFDLSMTGLETLAAGFRRNFRVLRPPSAARRACTCTPARRRSPSRRNTARTRAAATTPTRT